MAACMAAQAAIIAFGIGAILLGNVVLVFFALTLMGVQGAMLAPAKSGCVPEIVRRKSISAANGVLGMATIFSAVVGSVLGEECTYSPARPGSTAGGYRPRVLAGTPPSVGWAACWSFVDRRPIRAAACPGTWPKKPSAILPSWRPTGA